MHTSPRKLVLSLRLYSFGVYRLERYITVSAPPAHINVQVREGNKLAMQGEVMTNQAACKTPFNLLVVLSDEGASIGDLFLDNGVDITMGREKKTWSFVVFSAISTNNSITITSNVINRDFAVAQKWIINKISILGFRNRKNIQAYTLQAGGRVLRNHGSRSTSNPDKRGQFIVAEIPSLQLSVGYDFMLKLKLEHRGDTRFTNYT
ncbi:hypothetical protein RND81_05G010300 [Saponaria officinalis]|uniref:Uncharacterized protein n=1 Tax=Saponaria officinalis TaxID=3572 RepID=A0AAW1KW85_SAPOF